MEAPNPAGGGDRVCAERLPKAAVGDGMTRVRAQHWLFLSHHLGGDNDVESVVAIKKKKE